MTHKESHLDTVHHGCRRRTGAQPLTENLQSLNGWSAAASAALLALGLVGCSSDTLDGDLEIVPETTLQPAASPWLDIDEEEAQFQEKLAASLSAAERALVEERLADIALPDEDVRIVGRMVLLHDVYIDAEALLTDGDIDAATDQTIVAKGRILAATNTASVDGIVAAPHLFARRQPCSTNADCPGISTCSTAAPAGCVGTLQFFRPRINNNVMYVVPDAPAFLLTAFTTALANIKNAADDCLSGQPIAVTQSFWDSLGIGQASTAHVFVRYISEDPCGGKPGCAVFPRFVPLQTGPGASQQFMLPGTRIALDSDLVTNGGAANLGIIMHEILHTLGLAHTDQPPASSIVVPGTMGTSNGVSIMRSSGGSQTLTPDDRDTIDTLYSAQPGSSCYPHAFETILAN